MKRVRGGGLGGGAGFVTLILRMQIRSRDGNQRPADRFYGCLCKVPIDNTFALSGRGCVAVVTQGAASLALGYVLLGFQPVLGLLCALSVLFSARSRSAVRSQRTAFSPFPVCCALSACCFQPVPGLLCALSGRAESCSLARPERPTIP